MYLDKVETQFAMDQVHRSLALFCVILVTDRVSFRGSYWLPYLRFLMVCLPPLLINLGQCRLSYSQLQKDSFHPVKLVQIMFHISYGVRCLAWVSCHHTEVNERSCASATMFERYHL